MSTTINILIELRSEISEAIELWKQWLLKGLEANKLHSKIRDPLLLWNFKNKFFKAKYEKLIRSIDTIWIWKDGYTWWSIFNKYKEIIDLEIAQQQVSDSNWEQDFNQEFFKTWEEANISSLLRSLFSEAKKDIIIYDKFFSVELLRLLWETRENINIKVIYNEEKGNIKDDELSAFEVLYKKRVYKFPTKDNSIHDRYYIIDWSVYSLWSSVQKKINWTLFTPVVESEWIKIIKEIEGYLR